MFKTGEILKNAYENVKKNLWIYLAVVLIYNTVAGIVGGASQMISQMGGVFGLIASGNYNHDRMLDVISATSGSAGAATLLFGLVVTFFVINPLTVGMNKFFVGGVKGKNPNVNDLIAPFKNNYMNIVKTIVISDLLFEIIVMGIAFAYILCLIIASMPMAMNEALMLLSIIGIVIFTILYVVTATIVRYDFHFIKYLLIDNPETRFSQAYGVVKKMLKGKKIEILKVDIIYTLLSIIPLLMVLSMICFGIIQNLLALSIIGFVVLIPCIIFMLFVSVFQNAAFADIYEELKADYSKSLKEKETHFTYEAPCYDEPISYVKEENDEVFESVQIKEEQENDCEIKEDSEEEKSEE